MENTDQILDAPQSNEIQLQYAGFWIRVGAYLIDVILLVIVNAAISLITTPIGGEAAIVGLLIFLILWVGYFPYMESSENQATIGKMAVGIKVGDANGRRITFANALGRFFAKLLSGMILYIGYMMVGWDEKNQGLHDK